MNKKIFLLTLVILTIVSISAVSAADVLAENETVSEASTIEIDNTMTNAEIQAKLDTATDNSVINFATGDYSDVDLVIGSENTFNNETNETVSKTIKNLTINGNGATLTGTPKGMYYKGIFEVKNVDGFTLSGFNFVAKNVTAANMMTPSCVIIFNTTNGIIEDNNISGGRFGLYVGSKFTNPNYDTIVRRNVVSDVTDMGIISFGSARTYIVNNTIINPANHGIDARHGTGPNCTIENNYITGAREGIYLMHSQGHKALNNTIENSMVGITFYGSSNILADYNIINNTKIGFLLSAGYSNIQIGENNDLSGLYFTPMPPTFTYNILKGDSSYVGATSGTFSQTDANSNVTYVQVYLPVGDAETLDPLEIESASTIVLNESILALNDNITVKIWKVDDNNHIEANETINVAIDGVDYSGLSDFTGAVYVPTDVLTPGKHYMTVKFPGTGSLKESTWSTMLQVGEEKEKQATVIQLNNMTTKSLTNGKIRNGEYFVFNLTDANGNPIANKTVQIGFNGKVYNKTTNENGSARLQVNLVRDGGYTFAISFLGDEDYNASFNVAKITVVKQKGSLTAPNKSFKASATKTLTTTFKDDKGQVVSGRKVTFTVNGKTYTAKTNSKGVATVKVSLSTKKTYAYTVKFAGDKSFNAITKSGKITVK